MPYKVTWLDEVVIVKLSGAVSIQDLHELRDTVGTAPQANNIKKRVVNCLYANAVESSASDVKIFAHIDGPSSGLFNAIDTAIVATDPSIRKLASLYIEGTRDYPWETELFDSLNDAFAWVPDQTSVVS